MRCSELAREHKPAADDIERIDVVDPHAAARAHQPSRSAERRSTPSSACSTAWRARLLDRTIAIEHFEGDAYERRRRCASSCARVHAAPYTTAQFPADNHFGAEVRVTLRGGKVLSGKVDQPFGRTSDNPLPASLLKEKFDNCARARCRRSASGSSIRRYRDSRT